MPRTKEAKRLHICLDLESYTILKQKAAYKNVSMNEYFKNLALNISMQTIEIGIHDISKMLAELESLTFKASGYYNTIIFRNRDNPEVGLDEGESMIRLFDTLANYMEKSYRTLSDNRKADIEEENKRFQSVIGTVPKSTYRNRNIPIEDLHYYDIDLQLTSDEKEAILSNINGTIYQNDISACFRAMIMSKYYITLITKTDDLNKMADIIYSAARYAKAFMTMMLHQGYECAEQAKRLAKSYETVRFCQHEIWNIIENDRRAFYRKNIGRVRIVDQSRQGYYSRERRRKETV